MGTGSWRSSWVRILTPPGFSFFVFHPLRQWMPREMSGTVPSPFPLRTPESCREREAENSAGGISGDKCGCDAMCVRYRECV